jgi:hypothetical protein
MDEMRQLCRILVRIIPRSERFFGESGTEAPAGGGNKMTENEIKEYIRVALGEAPQPTWALPEGWGQYLAGMTAPLRSTRLNGILQSTLLWSEFALIQSLSYI